MNHLVTDYIIENKNNTVAIVGGGGKTTTLLNIGDNLRNADKTALLFTTTHMEAFRERGAVLSNNTDEILRKCRENGVLIAGTPGKEHGMRCVDENVLGQIWDAFEYHIYEADGSKNHPIKVPADHEPVILPQTDLILVCMNIGAVDKTLQEACQRYELLTDAITPVHEPDTVITEVMAAEILVNAYRNRILALCTKNEKPVREVIDKEKSNEIDALIDVVYIINGVDDDILKYKAEKVRARIHELAPKAVVLLTSYPEEKRNRR